MSQEISNIEVWSKIETVAFYEGLTELQLCERYAFSKFILPRVSVLDVGVGAGRTVPYLSSDQRRYVGVDYSTLMIESCRKKYPTLPFHSLDAADLSFFAANQFDAVVFSFNGIDYLHPDDKRKKCLNEVRRVLRNDGTFIFSAHNASFVYMAPHLESADTFRKAWRILRSLNRSNVSRFVRKIRSRAFYSGHGYIIDPTHGGLLTHFSTPRFVRQELSNNGFRILEVVSSSYPVKSNRWVSPWYYYVARKS